LICSYEKFHSYATVNLETMAHIIRVSQATNGEIEMKLMGTNSCASPGELAASHDVDLWMMIVSFFILQLIVYHYTVAVEFVRAELRYDLLGYYQHVTK